MVTNNKRFVAKWFYGKLICRKHTVRLSDHYYHHKIFGLLPVGSQSGKNICSQTSDQYKYAGNDHYDPCIHLFLNKRKGKKAQELIGEFPLY